MTNLKSATAWSTAGLALSAVGGLTLPSVLARFFDTAVAADTMVWLGAVLVLSAIARLGLEKAALARVFQAGGLGPSQRFREVLARALVQSLLASGLLLPAAAALGLPPLEYSGLACLVVWASLEGWLLINIEVARGMDKHGAAALFGLGGRFVLASIGVVVVSGMGAEALEGTVATLTVTTAITALAGAIVIDRSLRSLESPDSADEMVVRQGLAQKNYSHYGAVGISSAIMRNADVVLAGVFAAPSAVLTYSVALRCAGVLSMPHQIATRSLTGMMVDHHRRAHLGQPTRFPSLAPQSARITTAVTFVGVVFAPLTFSVIGEELFPGTDGQLGSALIAIFGVGFLASAASGVCNQYLTVSGAARPLAWSSVFALGVCSLGYLAGLALANVYLLASASALALAAQNLVQWRIVVRRFGLDTSVASLDVAETGAVRTRDET